jgi:hypothetical protein
MRRRMTMGCWVTLFALLLLVSMPRLASAAPEPIFVDVECPTEVETGSNFEVSVEVENMGHTNDGHATITISFPNLTSPNDSPVDMDWTGPGNPIYKTKGQTIGMKVGPGQPAKYLLVEGEDTSWNGDDTPPYWADNQTLTVTLKAPSQAGTFKMYYRTTFCDSNWSNCINNPTYGLTDQQGWNVKNKAINVVAPASCDDFDNTDGECSYGSYYWEDTECHPGNGKGNQPYMCQKHDDLYCWTKLDTCKSYEYCYDLPGVGANDGAQCVGCYQDGHCGVDICADYECVECDSNSDCPGQICINSACVDCANDGDCPEDFVDEQAPYCPNSGEVVQVVTTHDFFCSSNECQNDVDQTPVTLAEDEDDDFCELADDHCGGCAHGKFDCDFDSECGPGLICGGGLFDLICWGPECGCCYPGETWDKVNDLCVDCVDDGDCDGPTPVCLDKTCVACSQHSHCDDDEELPPEYYCSDNETVMKTVTTIDYYCTPDHTCKDASVDDTSIVAINGAQGFCDKKSEHCPEECTENQYGCESDSECGDALKCDGTGFFGCGEDSCGCCPQGKLWDTATTICIIDCDLECEVSGETKCDGDNILTCTDLGPCNNWMSEPCGEDYICDNGGCKYWPDEVSGSLFGEIVYTDQVYDLLGYTGEQRTLPVPYARVALIDGSGDEIAGTEVAADVNGEFELTYAGQPPGSLVSLRVYAENDSAEVSPGLLGATYVAQTNPVNIGTGGFGKVDVEIPLSDSVPFNLLDLATRAHGFAESRDEGNAEIGQVNLHWPSLFSSSFYVPVVSIIEVPEEYGVADGIVLHEYGHHVQSAWTGTDWSPGGSSHAACLPYNTELAWNEGFATYFAAAVQEDVPEVISSETSAYLVYAPDVSDAFEPLYNLEYPNCNELPLGAKVEGATASILWDIHDTAASGEPHDQFNSGLGEERIFSLVSTSLGTWYDAPDLCEFLYSWHEWGWGLTEIESILEHHGVPLTTCNTVPEILSVSPTQSPLKITEGDTLQFSAFVANPDSNDSVWAEWTVDGEVVQAEELPTKGPGGLPPGTILNKQFSSPGQFFVELHASDTWGSSAIHQWIVLVGEFEEPVFSPVVSSSLPIKVRGWKSLVTMTLMEDLGLEVALEGPDGPYEVGVTYAFKIIVRTTESGWYPEGPGCRTMWPKWIYGCGQSWLAVLGPLERVSIQEDWEIKLQCQYCDQMMELGKLTGKLLYGIFTGGISSLKDAIVFLVNEAISAVKEALLEEVVESLTGETISDEWTYSSAGLENAADVTILHTHFGDNDDSCKTLMGGSPAFDLAEMSFQVEFLQPGLVPVSAIFDLWGIADSNPGTIIMGECFAVNATNPIPTFIQHFRQITYLAEVVGGSCGDGACEPDENCEVCPSDCPGCEAPCGDGVCAPDEDCTVCYQDCSPCCGNMTCESGLGEDCTTCPSDCGGCCGDDECIPYHNEDCTTCAEDCGDCCGDNNCSPGLGETCLSCVADCGNCCGNGICEGGFGENCLNCSADCGLCSATCGNGECNDDETCAGCPIDCGSCCGDGECVEQHGENCLSCAGDCSACCGDGQCNYAENCLTCEQDCGVCCGNQVCQPGVGESCQTCAEDCGECPVTCGDGECSPDEGCLTCPADCGTCCGDGKCSAIQGENCSACSLDCGQCCGNGKCEMQLGEDCAQCSQDCGPCCGNGVCEAQQGENCGTCPADCNGCCGNSVCEPGFGEDCAECPTDCGDCADCGDGACDDAESCASCPADCGLCCGDSSCQFGFGETCATCPGDCGKCCGNEVCEKALGETCDSCAPDCGECCGDDWCQDQYGEDCLSCVLDCGDCCGDGQCVTDHGEDCETCEVDCGLCPPICGDGVTEQNEQCDDGGLLNDDGCSDMCTFESAKEGSIIVSEIMANPDETKDMHGEWFELYNTEKFTIDIDGWTLSDNGIDKHTINSGGPLALAPGSFLVLGNNNNQDLNGGVKTDYVYDGLFLSESGDEIILSHDNSPIDAVAWGPGLEVEPGYSLSLHPQLLDHLSNDLPDSWCNAISQMAGGDYGTPGVPNESCFPYCGDGEVNQPTELCDDGNNLDGDGCTAECTMELVDGCGDGELDAGEMCDDGNSVPGDGCSPDCVWEPPPVCGDGMEADWEECDDGNQQSLDGCSEQCELEELAVGDVIITEVMPNPAGVSDMHGEWFEVFNNTTWPINLAGWEVEDDSGSPHLIDAGDQLWIEPGASFVFGVSNDLAKNGGVTVDYVYGSDIQLFHVEDGIIVRDGPGGEVIDEFWFDGNFPAKPGYSLTLSTTAYDYLDNDFSANWCLAAESDKLDSGDFGSPGKVNAACDGTICGDGAIDGEEECDPGEGGDWNCCTPDFCAELTPCCGNGECEIPHELCVNCEEDCGPCPCAPDCGNKNCLQDDGCGDTCGCQGELVCCGDGSCKTECSCQPICTGKFCGPDGCGGNCGQCPGQYYQCEGGQCICQPDCSEKACGSDGCEGSCGTCPDDEPFCQDGLCVENCTPDCAATDCGDNGCGGSCGDCPKELDICVDGACVCLPSCADRECGADGCTGDCGECGNEETCDKLAGICVGPPVEPFPDSTFDLIEQPDIIVVEVVPETVSVQDGSDTDQRGLPDTKYWDSPSQPDSDSAEKRKSGGCGISTGGSGSTNNGGLSLLLLLALTLLMVGWNQPRHQR